MTWTGFTAQTSLLDNIGVLEGPEFLAFYVAWFFLIWIGVCALRRLGFDHPLTTLAGLTLYEGAGVIRVVVGLEAGMENFGFLIFLMFLGAIVFLARAKHWTSGRRSRKGSDSCGGFITGGGCGSGSSASSGCGGGGCGGCGGA